ncbi:TRAP transporter substrate-binding protein [Rhodoferax sp. TS-BS-61-7]|uniref:TRAP transporter substrate-binding protein n=1 Tax=Rhodoferax sp. TS-BS-61-7 TaxID=2094194 RepID=UPI000CF702FA|nr:TRAP transporter substrate-binding protein [Rhodoferax sp. TS-BS-61-7]PQA76306.1 C4-dicarboxylate ABC transporter substrate-binding protein [Rhodoferax sp. TS-BS-61-7]
MACASAGAQTKLRAWNIHPDGYPVTEAMKRFASLVSQNTGGRYQIDIFSNATLGDQPKAVQMLKAGEVDVAEFSSGPLSDAVPGLKALNLPFLFSDSAHMFKHLDGKLGERFAAKLQTAGFVVLGWYDGGGRSFYCASRTVNSFKDLAGARIRVQQSEIYIEMVKLLEATPVALPFKEVLGALEQNTVDCAENNMPSFESTGHYKVAKSVYVTNHVVSPEALVVSTKLWASLSPADKAVFAKAGTDSAATMRELWNKRVASAIETATKQGVQFVRVKDVAPMVRRMAPMYGKYMADPSTREELLTIIGN